MPRPRSSDVATAKFEAVTRSACSWANPTDTFELTPDTLLVHDVRPLALQTGHFNNDLLDDAPLVAGAAGRVRTSWRWARRIFTADLFACRSAH